LETGLGGRLDATNAVENKLLTVITRISLEHVEYLGHTLAEIAGEKAGIMKANTPAVCWETGVEVTSVFQKKAAELSVPCHLVSNRDYSFLNFKNKSIDFSYISRYDYSVDMKLHTIAAYQVENCTLALRAIEVLDTQRFITTEMLQKGVAQCFWAGRMEEVAPEIYVDGAHNADGIRAFLETVQRDGYEGRRKLVFSVVSDKDYSTMLESIAESGLFDRIWLAQLDSYRATSLEEMKCKLPETFQGEVRMYASVQEAFQAVCAQKHPEERVYIVGSLYLVGEIKEYLSND
ncbi:MAG: bifunctional folylpolyglutamate synthase/dihydrofolate synthase, partial [Lachnospiraceae bacterium]|nr:bifunctional folylpolyglutamate synthase/dihydrofolate synthase [Lachnospiraceae bacterium]